MDNRKIKKAREKGFSEGKLIQALKESPSLQKKPRSWLFKKLPNWVFILSVILMVVIILFIGWHSVMVLKDIQQISVDIAQTTKNIKLFPEF